MGIESLVVNFIPEEDRIVRVDEVLDRLLQSELNISVDEQQNSVKSAFSSAYYILCQKYGSKIELEIRQTNFGILERVTARFAYCSPTSTDEAFLELVRFLMEPMRLRCDIIGLSVSRDFNAFSSDYNEVMRVLLESIELNRNAWFETIDNKERIPLRPDDAWHYFLKRDLSE